MKYFTTAFGGHDNISHIVTVWKYEQKLCERHSCGVRNQRTSKSQQSVRLWPVSRKHECYHYKLTPMNPDSREHRWTFLPVSLSACKPDVGLKMSDHDQTWKSNRSLCRYNSSGSRVEITAKSPSEAVIFAKFFCRTIRTILYEKSLLRQTACDLARMCDTGFALVRYIVTLKNAFRYCSRYRIIICILLTGLLLYSTGGSSG